MLQAKIDATVGEPDKVFQFVEIRREKLSVLGNLRDFGVPTPGSELATTRDAIQAAIEDLNPTIGKLKEMKLADFIDVAPMKGIENEGDFRRVRGLNPDLLSPCERCRASTICEIAQKAH